MTQPDSNATPAASAQPDGHLGDLTTTAAIALLLAHADDALTLEHRAADRATAQLRVSARQLMTWSTRTWVARYGSLDARIDSGQWADLRPHAVREVRAALPPSPAPVVLSHARQALDMGTRQAAVALAVPAPTVRELAPETVTLAKATEAHVAARYDTTERLLTSLPVESHTDLVTVLAPTQAAVSDVDRDARTVVNTAVNQGAQDVAETHGADLLWQSLRDACVVCLALSGTVVGHDEDFPLAATFGAKPTEWWSPPGVTLLRPPRHNRCRCRCEPWLGHNGSPGSLSLPDALKREAQRSILKGWSVPSESERVRVDAAERLLARGSDLPKSVQAAAREAVRRRKFATRTVPSGR